MKTRYLIEFMQIPLYLCQDFDDIGLGGDGMLESGELDKDGLRLTLELSGGTRVVIESDVVITFTNTHMILNRWKVEECDETA